MRWDLCKHTQVCISPTPTSQPPISHWIMTLLAINKEDICPLSCSFFSSSLILVHICHQSASADKWYRSSQIERENNSIDKPPKKKKHPVMFALFRNTRHLEPWSLSWCGEQYHYVSFRKHVCYTPSCSVPCIPDGTWNQAHIGVANMAPFAICSSWFWWFMLTQVMGLTSLSSMSL
jgi:hypothetical protein